MSPRDASTSIKIASPMGKAVEVTLPKNLDAKGLAVTVNPTTGEYKLTAEALRTDASGVIDSAGAAQATAIGKLTDTVTALAPLLTPKP